MDRAFQRCRPLMLRGTFYSVPPTVRHEKGQAVVCYERCIFDLDDYQRAIDRSRCKLHHPQAPIIRPLYSQFITRQEWKGIFLNVAWIVLSVLMVLGVILNYQADRKKA